MRAGGRSRTCGLQWSSRSNLEYLLTVAAQELAEAPDSTGTHPVFGVTVEGSPRILSPAL